MNSILKISDGYSIDESISRKEIYSYYPITGTQLNNPGNISIVVQNSDNFYLPSESYLEIEGVVKKGAGHFANTDIITFANNGILHIFDNMKYLLSSTEIESVYNPGTVSNIIGLAKYPTGFKNGLIQCWAPDTDNDSEDTNKGFAKRRSFLLSSNPIGSFRFAIPLKHIFGFFEDYEKVLYGFVHTLVLTRSASDNNALFRKTGVSDGTISLENIRWMLPRVSPSDVARYELLKQIKAKSILNVGFRMRQCVSANVENSTNFTWRLGVRSSPEQPRFIFLAFQTDREGSQEKNYSTYDHCNLISAHLLMNNDRYPLNDFETDFTKNYYNNLYWDFASFLEKFYGTDPIITSTSVDAIAYKNIFPIVLFDVSKQSERLTTGVTDITLQCRFKANCPKKTIGHAIMISDRKLRFASDGEKCTVLF